MMRKHLQGHARLYALMLGATAALLILAGVAALAIHLVFNQVNVAMSRTEDEVTNIRVELQTTFARLNVRNNTEHCTTQGLIGLRGMMMDLRFVREIGLYDEMGRLFCTSGVGQLPEPFFESPSSMINSQGQVVWMDVPLIMTGGETRATIVRDGNFNVVLDPQISRSFQVSEGIDAMWFVSGRRVVPLSINTQKNEGLTPILGELARQAQGESLDWVDGQAIVTRRIKESDYVIQAVLVPGQILGEHPYLMAGALALAAMFAWLSGYAAIARLRDINSLATRVRALVSDAHVSCVYQPIVELATGKVIGCEVLMRIQDDGQTIFPDQAIPYIMKQGLSWQLDRLVSIKAITELKARLPAGQPFKVAFNFFPENLGRPEFKPHLKELRALAGNDLAINVEVTEYSFAPESIEVLHSLKDEGYFVSVDDFGTGYSNLGTIKRVAPDFLKIDKSFVFEMEDASLRSNLIPEIAAIARAVGADLIAEGVENERQAKGLLRLGVRYAQGYYFSRPLAGEVFIDWMQKATMSSEAIARAARPAAHSRRTKQRMPFHAGRQIRPV